MDTRQKVEEFYNSNKGFKKSCNYIAESIKIKDSGDIDDSSTNYEGAIIFFTEFNYKPIPSTTSSESLEADKDSGNVHYQMFYDNYSRVIQSFCISLKLKQITTNYLKNQ